MPNAFLLHGIYGNPEENWFPWLKHKLHAIGIETHIPHFPMTEPITTLADHLDCDVTVIEGAGHFNAVAGYKTFPLLLDRIHFLYNK